MIYARMDARTLNITYGVASEQAKNNRLDHPFFEHDNDRRYPTFDAVVMFFKNGEKEQYMEYRLYYALEIKYKRYAKPLCFRRKTIERNLAEQGYEIRNHFRWMTEKESNILKAEEKMKYEEIKDGEGK